MTARTDRFSFPTPRRLGRKGSDAGRIVLMLIVAATAGSCKQAQPSSPTLLETRVQPYVPDVPVPTGFERDERKSNYQSTAGRRQVRDFYKGKDNLLAVRNFYMHYMPVAGWELLDEKLQNAVYVLNFRKDVERCEVRVERVPAGSFGTITQVRVIIQHEP